MKRLRVFLFFAFSLVLTAELFAQPAEQHEMRMWIDDHNKKAQARFIEMKDSSTIVLERENGKRISVPLNRLSADDRNYVRRIRATISDKSKGETLADSRVGKSADTIDVIVTGIGKDADTALRNAFRNAVGQVVGTLVSSEQQVVNDQLIRDEILTHSRGYIKSHRILDAAKPVDDGLMEVRVIATVSRTTLTQKMRDAKIIMEKTIEQGIVIEAAKIMRDQKVAEETRKESNLSAAEFLEKAFEGFQEKILDTLDVSVRGALKSNVEAGTLEANVVISANRRKYDEFTNELGAELKQILGNPVARHLYTNVHQNYVSWDIWNSRGGQLVGDNERLVGICTSMPTRIGDKEKSRWSVYLVDPENVSVLENIPDKSNIILVARIVDGNGDVLSEQRISPPLPYLKSTSMFVHPHTAIVIFPTLSDIKNTAMGGHSPGRSEATIRVSFPIPDGEMENAKKVQFLWETK